MCSTGNGVVWDAVCEAVRLVQFADPADAEESLRVAGMAQRRLCEVVEAEDGLAIALALLARVLSPVLLDQLQTMKVLN